MSAVYEIFTHAHGSGDECRYLEEDERASLDRGVIDTWAASWGGFDKHDELVFERSCVTATISLDGDPGSPHTVSAEVSGSDAPRFADDLRELLMALTDLAGRLHGHVHLGEDDHTLNSEDIEAHIRRIAAD